MGVATSCDGVLPDFIPENVFYRLAMKAKNEFRHFKTVYMTARKTLRNVNIRRYAFRSI